MVDVVRDHWKDQLDCICTGYRLREEDILHILHKAISFPPEFSEVITIGVVRFCTES